MNLDSRLAQLGDRLERSIGDELRRTAPAPARRRVPIFAVATAGLAAAGVATILLAGSGGGAPGGGGAPSATVPAGSMRDSAYVVRRVRERIAADAQQGAVTLDYRYTSGSVAADGALVGVGAPVGDNWSYEAPDGSAYGSDLSTGATVAKAFVTGNVVADHYLSYELVVNHGDRTYSLQESHPFDDSTANTGAGMLWISSTSAQVTQGLKDGQAVEKGTTTVNGRQAIVLAVTDPGQPAGELIYLYVDAQTYQPLREVVDQTSTDGGEYQDGLYVSDWYPSTAANVALAEDHTIPDGYTRVPDASGDTGNSGNTGS